MSFDPSKSDFETVYDRYADLLFRISFSCTRHRENAEDVVHDVFMRYLDYGGSFRDEAHRRAWLLRVTINRSRDYLRREKIRQYEPLEDFRHLAAPAEATVALPVEELPEKYREPVLLHYYEGFSVEEVAKILMVTPSAVKMRLQRAREKLRFQMEKEETES